MPRGSLRCGRKKYSSHHALKFGVVGDRGILVAGELHGLVEGDGVGIVLRCAGGRASASDRRRRRTIAATSPPCGCSCARPARWGSTDARSAKCRSPRSAGLPRRRASACGIRARIRRSTVEVWTPTFSKTRPCIIDMMPPPPLPSSRCQGVLLEPAGRPRCMRTGEVILDCLESRADAVAQRLEPGARLQLLVVRCPPAGRPEFPGVPCAFSAIRAHARWAHGHNGTRLFGRRSLICCILRVKEFFLAHPGKTAARRPEEEARARPSGTGPVAARWLRARDLRPAAHRRPAGRPGNGSTAGPSRLIGPRSKAGPSVRATSSSSPSAACRLRTDQRSALPSWRRASPAAMAAARATLRLRPPPGIGINTR